MIWMTLKTALRVGALGLGLMALAFGTDLGSYLTTFGRAAREGVRERIPVEVELDRAAVLVDAIRPDLERGRRDLARSEVALEDLDVGIARLERRLEQREAALASIAATVPRGPLVLAGGAERADGRMGDGRLAADWARELESARRERAALESKRALRERQIAAVEAARERLAAVGARRVELQDELALLHTQRMQVEALEATVPSIGLDESSLTRASELIVEIDRSLRVREKACEQELVLPRERSGERDPLLVAAEIEAYLADNRIATR